MRAEAITEYKTNDGKPQWLGMMAKHWTLGTVKTRLAHHTGHAAAAAIHEYFTVRLTQRLAGVAEQRCVFVTPDDACASLGDAIDQSWLTSPQGSGDLGARMAAAFQWMLGRDGQQASNAIIIGADLPTLSPADLDDAFGRLAKNDLVLGPAVDGGYYLIGIRGPWRPEHATLFRGIQWSTASVFKDTCHLAKSSRLSASILAMREDIDTLESLQRLLASGEADHELTQRVSTILAG